MRVVVRGAALPSQLPPLVRPQNLPDEIVRPACAGIDDEQVEAEPRVVLFAQRLQVVVDGQPDLCLHRGRQRPALPAAQGAAQAALVAVDGEREGVAIQCNVGVVLGQGGGRAPVPVREAKAAQRSVGGRAHPREEQAGEEALHRK